MDGKAYTASELGLVANLSTSYVSNHLSKLLKGNIVKVDVQGRHRYYSFANRGVAYVVESLANLANANAPILTAQLLPKKTVKYCRTCYDHLAGYVGVSIADAMVNNRI